MAMRLKESQTGRASPDGGFTILELVITMIIATILAFSAVVGVSQWYEMFSKQNAQMQVLQDLRLAQVTTVEQGCWGIFKVDTNQRGYSFGCDYLPYSTASPPDFDVQIFHKNLPSTIKISTDAQIMYNSRGQVIDATGFYTDRSVTLSGNTAGVYSTFATGTLTATGFFSYAQ